MGRKLVAIAGAAVLAGLLVRGLLELAPLWGGSFTSVPAQVAFGVAVFGAARLLIEDGLARLIDRSEHEQEIRRLLRPFVKNCTKREGGDIDCHALLRILDTYRTIAVRSRRSAIDDTAREIRLAETWKRFESIDPARLNLGHTKRLLHDMGDRDEEQP